MRVLIIGQNSKIANVFSYICTDVYMVVDKKISNYRSYKENSRFHLLDTSLNIRSPKAIIPRTREIRHWAKKYDIDVVFTNEKYSMIAAKLAQLTISKKFRHISTSHNSYAWLNESNVKKFVRLINITCDGYIAMASFAYNAIKKAGLKENKLLLLPNALEKGLFKTKSDYKIKEDVCKIVYTATVYPGKSQDIAIEVIQLLNEKGVKTSLDIFGDIIDEEYYKMILRKVKEYGLTDSVKFHGRVDNEFLRTELYKYDIYLCPTQMEMSPFNILEAQQAALPIVASNVGGIPDLVKDGYSGVLLEHGNTKLFAESIHKLVLDQQFRKTLGQNGLFFSQNENSPAEAAKKLSKFIFC